MNSNYYCQCLFWHSDPWWTGRNSSHRAQYRHKWDMPEYDQQWPSKCMFDQTLMAPTEYKDFNTRGSCSCIMTAVTSSHHSYATQTILPHPRYSINHQEQHHTHTHNQASPTPKQTVMIHHDQTNRLQNTLLHRTTSNTVPVLLFPSLTSHQTMRSSHTYQSTWSQNMLGALYLPNYISSSLQVACAFPSTPPPFLPLFPPYWPSKTLHPLPPLGPSQQYSPLSPHMHSLSCVVCYLLLNMRVYNNNTLIPTSLTFLCYVCFTPKPPPRKGNTKKNQYHKEER